MFCFILKFKTLFVCLVLLRVSGIYLFSLFGNNLLFLMLGCEFTQMGIFFFNFNESLPFHLFSVYGYHELELFFCVFEYQNFSKLKKGKVCSFWSLNLSSSLVLWNKRVIKACCVNFLVQGGMHILVLMFLSLGLLCCLRLCNEVMVKSLLFFLIKWKLIIGFALSWGSCCVISSLFMLSSLLDVCFILKFCWESLVELY